MRSLPRCKTPEYLTKCHPLVKQLNIAMFNKQMPDRVMADEAGVARQTLSNWRSVSNPNISDLEACFNVLGFTLKPIKMMGARDFSLSATQDILEEINTLVSELDKRLSKKNTGR